MKYWIKKVVNRYCEDFGYKSLCEIGASLGGATDRILEMNGIQLTVIDPCLDADLCAKYRNDKRVTIYKGLSLVIIPKLSETFDCILIDGDHNWYTVFNELREIEERHLLRNGGTIFLHDVDWPYGRRDAYYQPDTIPDAFRHAYAKKGNENSDHYDAETEGGERNGVLTAIEDFVRDRGDEYMLFCFKAEFGLGVLVKKNGIKSQNTLAKWRLLCAIWNIFGSFIITIKHRDWTHLFDPPRELV